MIRTQKLTLSFICGVLLFYASAAAQTTENLTITTYYPSPAGSYRTLRFVPNDAVDPTTHCGTIGGANQEGTQYYDLSDHVLYLCRLVTHADGTRTYDWVNVSGDESELCYQVGGVLPALTDTWFSNVLWQDVYNTPILTPANRHTARISWHGTLYAYTIGISDLLMLPPAISAARLQYERIDVHGNPVGTIPWRTLGTTYTVTAWKEIRIVWVEVTFQYITGLQWCNIDLGILGLLWYPCGLNWDTYHTGIWVPTLQILNPGASDEAGATEIYADRPEYRFRFKVQTRMALGGLVGGSGRLTLDDFEVCFY